MSNAPKKEQRRSARPADKRLAALLAPPAELPIPRTVVDDLALKFKLLEIRDPEGYRRLFRLESKSHDREVDGRRRDYLSPDARDEWAERARQLAVSAAEDDEKLIELVRHDVRFLASPLTIARIMSWRLDAVLGRYKRDGRGPSVSATVTATKKLKQIGNAVSASGVSGSSEHISLADLADAEQEVRRKVQRAVKLLRSGNPDAPTLASRVGLGDHVLQLQELIAKPHAPEQVIAQILCARFRVNQRAMSGYLARLRRRDVRPREG